MKQGILGHRHGNNITEIVRTQAVDVTQDDFVWQVGHLYPFTLIMENDGLLVVQLAGEVDGEEKLTPFTKGTNPIRVVKVFSDVSNDTDGLILAGI